MSYSKIDGLYKLTKLVQKLSKGIDTNELFLYDPDEDSIYFQLYNAAYLIEYFVAKNDTQSLEKAKTLADFMNQLLTRGHSSMKNEVRVGHLEAYECPSDLPGITPADIASVMPEPLRTEYLEEVAKLV